MPIGFIGRVSQANTLKQALDAGSQRTQAIANRVAGATLPGARPGDGFAVPAPGAQPGSAGAGQVDVEGEMVSLADEQIRYEATATLLQKAYQQIRTSIHNG